MRMVLLFAVVVCGWIGVMANVPFAKAASSSQNSVSVSFGGDERPVLSMKRIIAEDEFEQFFDSFPDLEKFPFLKVSSRKSLPSSSPSSPSPTPKAPPPLPSPSPTSSMQSRKAKKSVEGDNVTPDIPPEEFMKYVNAFVDSHRDPIGNTTILDVLLSDGGLEMVDVDTVEAKDIDIDDFYFASYTLLQPLIVKNSPMKDWDALNWTDSDWDRNFGTFQSLSESTRRGVYYFSTFAPLWNMLDFWSAKGIPNPVHEKSFTKKTNLPLSIIPYYKPPHFVLANVPTNQLRENIGSNTWLYGFSKILAKDIEEFASKFDGAESLFYHAREKQEDPKLASKMFVSMWTATNRAISPFHYDSSNIFHGVIQGRKKFLFLQPEDLMNLYTFPTYHPSSRNSLHCFTCPLPKKEVDKIISNFPLIRKIKRVFVADLHPGEAVLFPSFWPHEVRSESDIVFTISSGRSIDELDTVSPTMKGAKLFDDIWELPHQTQFLLLQSFFAHAAYGLFHKLDNRLGKLCEKLELCLPNIINSMLRRNYAPLGIFKEFVRGYPCSPIKKALHSLQRQEEMMQLHQQYVQKYVDSFLSVWKSGVAPDYGLLHHFHAWVTDQMTSRMEFYEIPFFLKACLT
eukprot:m.73360 g.73360  ORF g.73360 m.73360 type:complete len:625 (+) comp8419_c0_seq1:146-2020(+)